MRRYWKNRLILMVSVIIEGLQWVHRVSLLLYIASWSWVTAEIDSSSSANSSSITYGTSSTMSPTDTSLSPSDATTGAVASLGFFHGFVASFSIIIVSELGDKTFFIAAIMAMRHPRLTVFAGAISALAAMTVLSAGFGWLAHYIPQAYVYYISTFLFALFGIKMLRDGYYMSPNEGQEEMEEVQSDLRKRDDEFEKESIMEDVEGGSRRTRTKPSKWSVISRIFLQSFTLTFLAEWGDRSQFATILFAAKEDIYGVTLGGVIGHSICTGLAVIGGRMIAQKISVRTVTIIGGIVFLIFAITALFTYPEEDTNYKIPSDEG